MALKEWSDIASIVTGLVSLCIASVAMFYTFRQTRIDQEHNRISVMPHLEGVSQFHPTTHRFTFSIVNNGLGPAYIAGVVCAFDKKSCPENTDPIKWIANKLLDPSSHTDPRIDQVVADCSIRPGDSINVFSFDSSESGWRAFMEALQDRAGLIVLYKSAYGTKCCLNIAKNIPPKNPIIKQKRSLWKKGGETHS